VASDQWSVFSDLVTEPRQLISEKNLTTVQWSL